jgi:hypothetical protein
MTDWPDTDSLRAKVFADPVMFGAWCVAKMNKAGGYEAYAVFAGPNARRNAIGYAQQIFGEFDEITLEPDAAKKSQGT